MELGHLVKTRSITSYQKGDRFDGTFTFAAPDKLKGKHTKNMLFIYLGVEKIEDPIKEEEITARMGDLGWKVMTDEEYEVHMKARGYVKP